GGEGKGQGKDACCNLGHGLLPSMTSRLNRPAAHITQNEYERENEPVLLWLDLMLAPKLHHRSAT
ncbi:MAG: hypothetical protein V4630_07180, partial [Pseudomonadota bacterium]